MSDPATNDAEARLRPYLPRLALQWIEGQPESTFLALDGSLVFVDISGFTKMSERLARHGKVGAEEVTDVLGAVFARMLAVAYADGGGLLKFGGDALLLWFSGDEHPVRAARAAHGMRGTLRSIGRIETTAGKVTLRMSVGVNSGRFHFFLVGRSHREFLVTGPAATGTVLMESTATAGEILLGSATADALPEKVLGAVKGSGRLLRSEPPGLSRDVADADLAASGLDLVPFVSTGLRESVLAGTEPEHRAATVAFVHFDGTDELIEGHGPQAAADALAELVGDVQDAVDDQGLTFLASDVDADGGKLILTAGVPRVLGDDEERMLLALRRIVDGERRIPIRIGVNHGAVFAGDVGPAYRRTYTVMGDTVNLAARLMAKAGPGEIYATASVLDRSATRFELTELEPFMVKGKARPVEAWAVGAVAGRPRDVGTERYPLVGRERELEVLTGALEEAKGGRGRLIEIVGEPGIGKTRLLEELRERTEDMRSLQATAEAYTSSTPYFIWRELLREIIGVGWDDPDDAVLERLYSIVEEATPDLMPWLPLLAGVLDVEVAPTLEVEMLASEFLRPKIHETVGRFLGTLLDAPTFIQIEDAHLMDPASADLLTALTDGLGEQPWLILVTRRESEDGFVAAPVSEVENLRPEPLRHDEAVVLAKEASEDHPFLPHDLKMVAERSAGNPQFLLDLVRALASGTMLPDSVEAAAMAQIDELAPEDRAVVRRASVLGLSFHPRFVTELFGEGEQAPDERTWERLRGLLEEDGDGYLRFRRAIVRDAAYSALPFRTRRRLHGLAGAELERDLGTAADEAAGILSLHFLMAQEHVKAWRYARIAGDRAATLYANVEAGRLYQRALDAGRRAGAASDDLVAVTEARGDVLRRAALREDAAKAYADARRLCSHDVVAQARLLLKRGWLEEDAGKFPGALRWLGRGRRLVETEESEEARRLSARISARYASVLRFQGRMAEARRTALRAIAAAEAADAKDALAEAVNALASTDVLLGRPEAEDHYRRADQVFVEIGDRMGQAGVVANLGALAYYRGRWDEAVKLYERASDLYSSAGDPVGAAAMNMNVGEVLVDQGRLSEADVVLDDVAAIFRASGSRFDLGLCLAFRGRSALRNGRLADALELLRSAREELLATGAHSDALEVEARIAEARLHEWEPGTVLEQTDELLAQLRAEEGLGHVLSILHRIRGFALVQLGAAREAREAFEASLTAARAKGADYEVALTLQAIVRISALDRLEPPPGVSEECSSILRELGVLAVPAPPLRDPRPQ